MGKPQFENQMNISAVSSRTIAEISATDYSSLASGTLQKITIFSPSKTVSRLINVQTIFDYISETGTDNTKTKNIVIQNLLGGGGGLGICRFTGPVNQKLVFEQSDCYSWDYNSVETGAQTVRPNDKSALCSAIAQMRFDDTVGIQFLFQHFGTVATTAGRSYLMIVEREVVAR